MHYWNCVKIVFVFVLVISSLEVCGQACPTEYIITYPDLVCEGEVFSVTVDIVDGASPLSVVITDGTDNFAGVTVTSFPVDIELGNPLLPPSGNYPLNAIILDGSGVCDPIIRSNTSSGNIIIQSGGFGVSVPPDPICAGQPYDITLSITSQTENNPLNLFTLNEFPSGDTYPISTSATEAIIIIPGNIAGAYDYSGSVTDTDNCFFAGPAFLSSVVVEDCPCTLPDYDALIALYNSTNGDNWTNNTGWVDGAAGTDCDYCNWYGIECDGNNRVTCIVLNNDTGILNFCNQDLYDDSGFYDGNNLNGTIPFEIGDLDFLENLILSNNSNLNGSIPSSLYNLSQLKTISLASSAITGSLSSNIGNLDQLEFLGLYDTNLTGTMPAEVWSLPNLIAIGFGNTNISGNLSSIVNSSNLEAIDGSNTNFSGSIPSDISNLISLRYIAFDNCSISGTIPAEIELLTDLEWFSFANCSLNGEIPNIDLIDNSTVSFTTKFDLSGNDLSGCIPNSLFELCDNNFFIQFDLSANPKLPWQGDTDEYCLTDGSESAQINAPCDDGDSSNGTDDVIQEDCNCAPLVTCPTEYIITYPDDICEGLPFDFEVEIIGGMGPFDIDVTDGSSTLYGQVTDATGPIVTIPADFVPSGTFTFSAAITDSGNLCPSVIRSGVSSLDMTVHSGGSYNLSLPADPICDFEEYEIQVTIFGGTPPHTVSLIQGGIPIGSSQTGNSPFTFGGISNGTGSYFYGATVEDNFGCFYTASPPALWEVTVLSNGGYSVSNPTDPTCEGEDYQVVVSVTDGNPPYEVDLFENGVSIGTQNSFNTDFTFDISNSLAGEYDYTAAVSDDFGCVYTTFALFDPHIVLDAPTINATFIETCQASPDDVVTIDLTAYESALSTEENTISWFLNSNGFNPIPIPSAYQTSSSTIIYAQATSPEGCVSEILEVIITLTGSPNPIITSSSPALIVCPDNFLSLTVVGGNYDSYLWSTGAGETFATTEVSAAGTYYVTVTQGDCEGIGEVTVTESNFDLDCSTEGTDILVNSTNASLPISVAWAGTVTDSESNINDENYTISSLPEGEYDILVTDANGCESTCSTTIISVDCSHPDLATLLTIYNNTSGASWTDNDGWQQGASGESCNPCDYNGGTWSGINCTDDRVTYIGLTNNGLDGSLPSSISMDSLKIVEIYGNSNLSGALPNFNGSLVLEELNIRNNDFTGGWPTMDLPKLRILDFSDNHNLKGAIPSLSGIQTIEVLSCFGDSLSGNLNNFSQLTQIKELFAYNNEFDGAIPDFDLDSLTILSLRNNKLTGDLPPFSNLNLVELYVNGNLLVGDIPDYSHMVDLSVLNASNNDLSGCYPGDMYCDIAEVDFSNNLSLPFGGDYDQYCIDPTDEIGSSCGLNLQNVIDENCNCISTQPCLGTYSFEYPESVCADTPWEVKVTIENGTAPYDIEVFSNGDSVAEEIGNTTGILNFSNESGTESNTFTIEITDANGCTTFEDTSEDQNISVTNLPTVLLNFPNGNSTSVGNTITFDVVITQADNLPVDFTITGFSDDITRLDVVNNITSIEINGEAAGTYNLMVEATDSQGCTNNDVQVYEYTVTSDEPSAIFTIVGGEVAQGELLEVDIVAESFVDLTSFEFIIEWDSSVYSFIDIANIDTNNPEFEFGISNIGTPLNSSLINGQVSSSWAKFDGALNLNPNSVLFSIVLEAVGNECDSTPIEFVVDNFELTDPGFNQIDPIINNSELTISGEGCTELPHTCELLNVENPICNGGSGTITVDVQADETCTCNWYQNGSLIQSSEANTNCNLEDYPAGGYTFELVSDVGDVLCTFDETLLEPPAISISAIVDDEDCVSQGAIDLDVIGGIGNLTYDWMPNVSDNATAIDLATGIYAVTITDENGCTATAQETIISEITELDIDASDIVINNISCFGASDGSITVEATGGCPDYTYLWSEGDGNNLTAGSYTVTVTDSNGNTATEIISISEPTLLTATFEIVGIDNNGINILPQGGVSPYNFVWEPSISNTNMASELAAGIYAVTITDANGCTANIADIEIIEDDSCPPISWVSVPSDMSISYSDLSQIVFTTDYSNNGIDDCNFSGTVEADTTMTKVDCDVTIDLRWTATTDGVTIDTMQLITITDIPDPEWVDPPSDISIDCDDIQAISNQLIYSNDQEGIYEISGISLADITVDSSGCSEDRILAWSITSSDNCFQELSYTQQITVLGCFDIDLNDDYFSAMTQSEIQYDILDNDPIAIGDYFISIIEIDSDLVTDTMLTQDGIFSFTLSQSFFDTIKVTYEVCDLLCQQCESASLFITDEILEDVVPTNYISPNGDGQNDVLRFTGEDVIEGSELWIYNRWGDQIYHKENYTNDWDANGIPSGVYYYVLSLEGAILKKTITILK